MISGFENITKPLTEDELALVQRLIAGFKCHVGKGNAISSKEVVRRLKEKGVKITGVRLRKIVNYIRANSLAPICANNKGYWYSNDLREIQEEVKSLRQRSSGIEAAAKGLYEFIKINTGTQTQLIE